MLYFCENNILKMENVELKLDFQYFIDNQVELYKIYPNEFLVIKDKKVCFNEKTFEKALLSATEKFALGTFIIQFCGKDENCYTQIYHSRVVFA
jgi:hypothetical protein